MDRGNNYCTFIESKSKGELFRPWAVSGEPSIHTYQTERAQSIQDGPDACKHEIEAERASDMWPAAIFSTESIESHRLLNLESNLGSRL